MSVKFVPITVAFLAVALSLPSQAASRYYRYQNDRGIVVIRDTIPANMVHKGYTVLGKDGRVLKVVPRALTAEEIETKRLQEAAKAALAEKNRKRHEADLKLLSLYSNADDALRARDRKVDALTAAIDLNKSNIDLVSEELDRENAIAADRERAGKVISSKVLDNIGRLERQIRALEYKNTEYKRELSAVNEEFAEIVKRINIVTKKLKGLNVTE